MVKETDLRLSDGRTLHIYDTGAPEAGARLTVFWHHGTPNTGAPPEPLFPAAAERGIRWVSHDRPGYGASTPQPGRDVAAVAGDVAAIADALGIGTFAVMGHSGGGPHALACAALLPGRVLAVAAGSGPAPFDAEGLDWFAGRSGAADVRAAAAGRAAYEKYLATAEWDPEIFTPADHAALAGDWAWLGRIAGQAVSAGPDGMIDDELAYVSPWGFSPGQVTAPALLFYGGQDRMVPSGHGEWLAQHCPAAELWLRPDDGHVSVLEPCAVPALDWLVAQVRPRDPAAAGDG
jgi:pimeloyl-ACP methyl ester carboxylesterase